MYCYSERAAEVLFSLSPSYYKVTDPGSWFTFDRNTGELKVANTIDRESPLVHDGFYNLTVKAVDTSKLLQEEKEHNCAELWHHNADKEAVIFSSAQAIRSIFRGRFLPNRVEGGSAFCD